MYERRELPTKEEINAIGSLEVLREWETYIEPVIAKIEVDVSVLRPEDSDEEDWHGRARGALAVHKMTLQWVRGRMRRLTKGNIDHLDQYTKAQEAKAAKKEATAKSRTAHNEMMSLAAKTKEINSQNRQIAFMERTCYLAAFKKAVMQTVPTDALDTILDKAAHLHQAALNRELQTPKG